MIYSPSEAAELIGIKTATLRKYSLLLESNGYEIARNSKKHRYYRDKDLMTIRSIITSSNNGITLNEAVKNVVNFKEHTNESNVTYNAQELNKNDIQELKKMINKQSELILSLTSRLDQQNEYIDKKVEFKLNEAIEKAKEIEAPGSELAKEIEAKKEYDVFLKGQSETVEKPKENESSKLEENKPGADPEIKEKSKESPSRRSKKDNEKSFFSKLLGKLIIDTRDEK